MSKSGCGHTEIFPRIFIQLLLHILVLTKERVLDGFNVVSYIVMIMNFDEKRCNSNSTGLFKVLFDDQFLSLYSDMRAKS